MRLVLPLLIMAIHAPMHVSAAPATMPDTPCVADAIFGSLARKHRFAIRFWRETYLPVLLEKLRISTGYSFGTASALGIGRQGKPSYRIDGSVESAGWGGYLDLGMAGGEKSNSVLLVGTIAGSQRKKAAALDSLLALEKSRGGKHIESIFLRDFKSLLFLAMEISKCKEELSIRARAGSRLDTLSGLLASFEKAGTIGKRQLRLLELAANENELRRSAVEARSRTIRMQLQDWYSLNEDEAESVLRELMGLLYRLESRQFPPSPPSADGAPGPVSEIIDSIELKIAGMRNDLDASAAYSLGIGPSLSISESGRNPEIGMGVRFSMSILGSRPPADKGRLGRSTGTRRSPSPPDTSDRAQVKAHLDRIGEEIGSVLSDIRSGLFQSAYSLDDLVSKTVSAETLLSEMRATYLGYKINTLQSFGDMGLEGELTGFLAGE